MNSFIRHRLHIFTFVAVIFILGIGFGAIAVKTVDYTIRTDVFSYFNNFMDSYKDIDYSHKSLISESIKFNLMNIFIIYAFGLSMVLMPLISVLVFFKGFVLGFTVGFLVSEYSFKGILLVLAAVFPQNLIIIPIYILSSVMSIYMSIKIFKYYRGMIKIKGEELIRYSIEMGILAGILLLASIIETYISPFLLRLVLRLI